MFIIFGSPRSGTTLLSTTLDQNDHISIPEETDFIIPVAFIMNRIKDPDIGRELITQAICNSDRFSSSIGKFLTGDEIKNVVQSSDYTTYAVISNIYKLISEKSSTLTAGDKSPNDLLYIRILVETGFLQSQLKIIHIIRDVRDVILSLKKVKWDVDWKHNIEDFFPRMWSDSNLYLHSLMKNDKDRYYLVKYEDFISDPEMITREIACFLGVPFQEKMLDHTNRGLKIREQSHHTNLAMPFMADKIAEWRTKLDPAVSLLCEKQASECLQEFGYPLRGKKSKFLPWFQQ